MKEKKQNRHIYWNPYFGGFLLGILIIFTFFITGRGLGASGAMKSSVVTIVDDVSHEHAEQSAYYSKFVNSDKSPMNNWIVFETLGVLIGAFVSGALAGRIGWRVQTLPKNNTKT